MASGKQSPRQKMINMMYLVLTALLAMNVSKSILDSFVTIDEGQNITAKALSGKLDGQMSQFAMMAGKNEAKYGKDFKRAQEVQRQSKALITHINKIKAKTFALTEGLEIDMVYNSSMDTVMRIKYADAKDNYDVNTRVMFGTGVEPATEADNNSAGENEEGYNYRAAELKRLLSEYRDMIVANFDDKPGLVASTKNMFNFEGLLDVEGKEVKWEQLNFYHNPLAATTSILSKLQSDVLSVESDAIGEIFAGVEGKSYKFNKLAEAVIPEATYVTQGGTFNASVFLAAYDETNPPRILLGNPGVKFDSIANKLSGESTQLEMVGAKGVVKLPAGSVGPQHREGVIIFEPVGLPAKTVGFELDYTVAAPSLVVSPTKMNVFYRGLTNPVSISAAGFKDSDLSPSMSNGKLTRGANGWEVSGLGSGKEASISCSAKLPDGSSKSIGNIPFRVKDVPDPVAYFGGKSSSESSIKKRVT